MKTVVFLKDEMEMCINCSNIVYIVRIKQLKHKTKMKMKLFVLITVCLFPCFAIKAKYPDLFQYEKVSTDKELPDEFFSNNKSIISGPLFLDKDSMLHPNKGQMLTGVAFDLLCTYDLINLWSVAKRNEDIFTLPKSFDEFLESRKKSISLFCLGEVKISDAFQSYLILLIDGIDDEYSFSRSLFLLNVANKKCLSLTRVSDYYCFDGTCAHIYSVRGRKNIFTLKLNDICSDNNISRGKKRVLAKYMFDSKGMPIKI